MGTISRVGRATERGQWVQSVESAELLRENNGYNQSSLHPSTPEDPTARLQLKTDREKTRGIVASLLGLLS